MPRYLNEHEARTEARDALERGGFDKATAAREAEGTVRRVFTEYERRAGLSSAERQRKPNRE